MREKYGKRGHLSAPGWRPRYFGNIHIDGDFHYNPTYKLIYNAKFEEDELYMGRPCIYTDARFDTEDGFNYFHSTYINFARSSFPKKHRNGYLKVNRKPKDWSNFPLTLAACIRRMRQVKGLPRGVEVTFGNSWYYTKSKNEPTYVYIHDGKNGDYRPDYKVTKGEYFNNFTNDEKGNELIARLRANGFIVKVYDYEDDEYDDNEENPQVIRTFNVEMAIAYGHNKMIGISSNNNHLNGYYNGCDNILYDFRGCFDKWSRALEIPKNKSIDDILDILVNETKEKAYPF